VNSVIGLNGDQIVKKNWQRGTTLGTMGVVFYAVNLQSFFTLPFLLLHYLGEQITSGGRGDPAAKILYIPPAAWNSYVGPEKVQAAEPILWVQSLCYPATDVISI